MTTDQQFADVLKTAEQIWGEMTPKQFVEMMQQMPAEQLSKLAGALAATMLDVRVERRAEWAIKVAMAFLYPRVVASFALYPEDEGMAETISNNRATLMLNARLGERDAQDILGDFAEALTAQDKDWPLWLREHAAWAMSSREKLSGITERELLTQLTREFPGRTRAELSAALHALQNASRPKGAARADRRRGANRGRNIIIVTVVELVSERGDFNPTRHHRNYHSIRRDQKKARAESGCSIVSKALENLDIHMSEANVDAIWRDHIRGQRALSEALPPPSE